MGGGVAGGGERADTGLMCGLAGILRYTPSGADPGTPESSIPEDWLDLLDEAVRRRGPDDAGRLRDRVELSNGVTADVALVHRRLSILDPEGGAQPMAVGGANYRGRVAVVFNGCIYNHETLRGDLRSARHRFLTDHSDTEVLLHGYRQLGANLPEVLDGMYAFAVWDARKGELLLARDPAGEKPIYACAFGDGSGVAFASTAAALDRLLEKIGGSAPRLVNTVEWIARGAGGDTPIEGIHELPPGQRLRVQPVGARASLKPRRYWAAPTRHSGRGPMHALTVDGLDGLLDEAVRSRMISDAPVGCFLSGGVDSSLVAYYAQQEMQRRGRFLETFCVKMPDARYDESVHAKAAADAIGCKHKTIEVRSKAAEDLVELIDFLGLPLGDSSLLPAYWVSKAASKKVKVALSGDGADELFCGYDRHVAGRMLKQWGPLLRLLPRSVFSAKDPKSRSSKIRRLITAARSGGYHDLVQTFPAPVLRRLLKGHAAGAYLHDLPDTRDPARDDFMRYLPDDLLRKLDTAGMACGLEIRAPFLAKSVVETALAQPYRVLMPGGERKGLLRALARRHLPASIVDRPKMGFAIPIGDWFREDFGGLGQLLMDHLNSADPWPGIDVSIRRRRVMRMLAQHMSETHDHSQRLYGLLVLSIWARGRTQRSLEASPPGGVTRGFGPDDDGFGDESEENGPPPDSGAGRSRLIA